MEKKDFKRPLSNEEEYAKDGVPSKKSAAPPPSSPSLKNIPLEARQKVLPLAMAYIDHCRQSMSNFEILQKLWVSSTGVPLTGICPDNSRVTEEKLSDNSKKENISYNTCEAAAAFCQFLEHFGKGSEASVGSAKESSKWSKWHAKQSSKAKSSNEDTPGIEVTTDRYALIDRALTYTTY